MFEKISYRAAEWRLPPAFCLFLKAYFVANKPFTPSFWHNTIPLNTCYCYFLIAIFQFVIASTKFNEALREHN